MYKIWQGRQLFHQTSWMKSEYSLESLNFAAFTKPNKHKTDSKDFSTTWSSLFSNTFTSNGEFKRLLQSFFRKSLFATWWYRFTGTSDVNQRALKLPSLSHTCFLTRQIFTYPSPGSHFFLRVRSRPISARKWKAASIYLKRFSDIPRLKLTAGEGFCEDLSCVETCRLITII